MSMQKGTMWINETYRIKAEVSSESKTGFEDAFKAQKKVKAVNF